MIIHKQIRAAAIFSLVFISGLLQGQSPFQITIGTTDTEKSYAVIQLADSGFIVGGSYQFNGFGSDQLFITRTDKYGDTIWAKTYGNSVDANKTTVPPHASGDGIFDIQPTLDGNFIATGATFRLSDAMGDVLVMKFDEYGDTIWTKRYGGQLVDYGYSVLPIADSGYVVVGYTESFGAGNRNGYLLRLDESGDTIWTSVIGSTGLDAFFNGILTSNGDLALTGYTFSSGAGTADISLLRLDTSGSILWEKTYGSPQNEFGYAIRETASSGFIITGMHETEAPVVQNAFLLQTDSAGNMLWAKSYGGSKFDGAYDVALSQSGGYVFTGYTKSFASNPNRNDIYVVNTNSNGDTIWTKTVGGSEDEMGEAILTTQDSGLMIVGFTHSFGMGAADIYAVKLDSSGNCSCHNHHTETQTTTLNLQQGNSSNDQISGGFEINVNPIIGNTFIEIQNTCDLGIGIDAEVLSKDPAVFPNPSTGIFTVSMPANKEYSVFDGLGRLIQTESSNTLDIRDHPDGIYHVISIFNGRPFQIKIVKQSR